MFSGHQIACKKRNMFATMNNDLWVTRDVICQWFSLVTSSLMKIIANRLTHDPKPIIHGNSCTILYILHSLVHIKALRASLWIINLIVILFFFQYPEPRPAGDCGQQLAVPPRRQSQDCDDRDRDQRTRLQEEWNRPHPGLAFQSLIMWPGNRLTKCSWAHNAKLIKIHFALMWKIRNRSGHNFAHVTTAELSWLVQNFELIESLE